MAGLAFECHVDRRVAVPVVDLDRRTRRGSPPIAPLHERHERGEEVEALVGQEVLDAPASARLAIGVAAEHAIFDESGETSTQNLAGTTQVVLEVVEAAHTVEGLSQYEKRPFLPNHVDGALNGTPFPFVGRHLVLHIPMVTELQKGTQIA